ncbi:concanavalin A-like lectin/glucanase domain-containing protein [Gongronella butleri]|nr:concanavalin A-like lectin/glucanase domain-containing protein [Gongronella butleri]
MLIHSLVVIGLLAQLAACQVGAPTTCDCGFRDEAGYTWAHVWYSNFLKQKIPLQQDKNYQVMSYKISRQSDQIYERQFAKDHVLMTPDGIQLLVRKDDSGTILSGQFATMDNDILYGTFRSFIQIPTQPGTVSAFYYFKNNNNEIDVELLSKFNPPQAYFAIHPQIYEPDGSASNLTHGERMLPFDPAQQLHEYRFDWLPDQVNYYVDGEFSRAMNTNVPNAPGRINLNHWSDGNPNFSGDPPANVDITMLIANLTFFYNSSQNNDLLCQSTRTPCLVTDILNKRLIPSSEVARPLVARASPASSFLHWPIVAMVSIVSSLYIFFN